jgi:hypothetical protein
MLISLGHIVMIGDKRAANTAQLKLILSANSSKVPALPWPAQPAAATNPRCRPSDSGKATLSRPPAADDS